MVCYSVHKLTSIVFLPGFVAPFFCFCFILLAILLWYRLE